MKAPKLSTVDIEVLKNWCLHILDFFIEREKNSPATFLTWKEIVLLTYKNNNVKGMKMLYADINECRKGLSREQLAELNSSLLERFQEHIA